MKSVINFFQRGARLKRVIIVCSPSGTMGKNTTTAPGLGRACPSAASLGAQREKQVGLTNTMTLIGATAKRDAQQRVIK